MSANLNMNRMQPRKFSRKDLKTKVLNKDESMLLIKLSLMEQQLLKESSLSYDEYFSYENYDIAKVFAKTLAVDGEKLPFLSQILLKRLEGFAPNLKITLSAVLYAGLICKNPAGAVIIAMDLMEQYGLKEKYVVNLDDMCLCMYPNGFYDMDKYEENTLFWHIDTKIKNGIGPYTRVYNLKDNAPLVNKAMERELENVLKNNSESIK